MGGRNVEQTRENVFRRQSPDAINEDQKAHTSISIANSTTITFCCIHVLSTDLRLEKFDQPVSLVMLIRRVFMLIEAF